MTHLMIDTETFGKSAGAAVRSIGAVIMDVEKFRWHSPFYINVDVETWLEGASRKEADTVQWWNEQSAEAQAIFDIDPQDADTALNALAAYCAHHGVTRVWSHGATFDIPIIERCFEVHRIASPFEFRGYRDTRTIYDIFDVKPTYPETRIKHYALDDAKSQAEAVLRAYEIWSLAI